MVEIKFSKRFSAKQCLEHPWFLSETFDEEENIKDSNSEKIIENFKKKKEKNHFKNLVLNLALYKGLSQGEIQRYS